jgi:hypothetical protein
VLRLPTVTIIPMKCSYCSTPLSSENPKSKFCSPKCRVYASRGIKPKPNLIKEEAEGRKRFAFKRSSCGDGLEGDETNNPELDSQVTERTSKLKTPLKPWLLPESVAKTPMIFPRDMTKTDLMKFLKGGWELGGIRSGGIVGYNASMLSIGMPWRCTTTHALEVMLARSGYDPRLAQGVGYEPEESEFMKKVRENESSPARESNVPD